MDKRNQMEHLLTCARRGGYGGASGGEVRARRLVEALLENVPGLDGDCTDAAVELIERLSTDNAWIHKVRDRIGPEIDETAEFDPEPS